MKKSLKKVVERQLQDIYMRIGIDRPLNHDNILEFVVDDVEATADKDFSSEDVSIAFRRFVEAK